MKFGGTSTKDAAAMLNVTEIVKSRTSKSPVVVISAIAQATNQLETMGSLSKSNKVTEAKDLLKYFIDRHIEIVETVGLKPNTKDIIRKKIFSYSEEILEIIKGVSILGELTPKTLDRFYSYGELLSSYIISEVMKENSIDTVWLDTKEFMITDDAFTEAKPNMPVIEEKLRTLALRLIEEKKVIVTQGFIGVTPTGERTTMGRESSDFSAAVIGAVLDAEDVQIWTDVDGVLSGDPNIIENPKKIKVLSFEEAFQLSLFGAKVLHPNTMIPAAEKNIPIHVYNSKRPQISGTLITKTPPSTQKSDSLIKSVTYKPKVSLLQMKPTTRFSPYIFWENIFSVLNKYKVVPIVTSTSEYQLAVVFETRYMLDSIKTELATLGEIEDLGNLSLVSLMGQKLNRNSTIVQKVFSVLNEIQFHFISFGASEMSISILVNEDDTISVVRSLHKLFFEGETDSKIFEEIR